MNAKSLGAQSELHNKKHTGMYWAIAIVVLAIIAGALMFGSKRNHTTPGQNQGNNMSNTNPGHMITDSGPGTNRGGNDGDKPHLNGTSMDSRSADTNSPEATGIEAKK